MSKLNLVCCQLDIVWENKQANHAKVKKLLRESQPAAGSLIVLPEMFATGLTTNVGAIADDDCHSKNFLSDLARDFDSWIIAGAVNKGPHKELNQALLLDRSGIEIDRYSKVHLYSPAGEDKLFAHGERTIVCEIGGFKIAPVICYDLRFPELFRVLVNKGAELFVVIASWPEPRGDHWCSLLQARAIENQAFVVGVNRCGADPNYEFPGQSRIIDPLGTVLADAGSIECVLQTEVDLETLLSYRRELTLLGDRRPNSFN